ncbi:MAG: DUF4215 domain-containing protein [Kofleriaceae bacterium]
MRRGWFGGLIALGILGGSCVDDAAVRCADGTLCPPGYGCVIAVDGEPATCALDSFRDACVGADEDDSCVVPGAVAGRCHLGICRAVVCGDGLRQGDEACDDGNTVGADGCNASCTSNERCGNGIVELAERCDAGPANADLPDAPCRLGCELPRCGDGIVDDSLGEVCDDGNTVSADGCNGSCTSDERCGNGVLELTERCDAGAANADQPNAPCRVDCTLPTCGDGIIDSDRGETCDDGNVEPGDGCTFACVVESCGNGVIDYFAGEECDDGPANSLAPDAGCRPTCLRPRCGDGVADPLAGEACDDGLGDGVTTGNRDLPNAGCRTDCELPRCADGVLDDARGEVCDDGNAASGDGCAADCASDETCGNGVVDAIAGEVCDDGNAIGHDGCTACTVDTLAWARAEAAASPRSGYCGAYDPSRQVFVTFGGRLDAPSYEFLAETWENADGTWRRRYPRVSPPGRIQCAMAYDPRRGRIVLSGGAAAIGFVASDTWEWDGETWVQVATSGAGQRYRHRLEYVGSREAMLLYGTETSSTTYTWNGSAWSYQGLGPSPGRWDAGLAYDPVRDVVVMFGGGRSSGNPAPKNDTWEWDGSSWTQMAPTTVPPAVAIPMLWYSQVDHAVTLHVGDGNRWWYQDGEWTAVPLSASGPPAATDGMIGAAHDRQLLLGSTLWRFDVGTNRWAVAPSVPAPTRTLAAGAFDHEQRAVMVFGGSELGVATDTLYAWDGTSWRQLPPTSPWPSARWGHAMTYDGWRRRLVLFGGEDAGGARGDLWEWDGQAWTQIAVAPTWPAARAWASLTFDPVRGVSLLVAGRTAPGTYLADTWAWDGVAWTALPNLAGSARGGHGAAWDAAAGELIISGGAYRASASPTTLNQHLTDTLSWNGTSWTNRGSFSTLVPMRGFQSLTYDPFRRRVIQLGGVGFSSYPRDAWEWDGAASTWRFLNSTGPASAGHVAAFDPLRAELVVLNSENGVDGPGVWTLRRTTQRAEESCLEGIDVDLDGDSGCADADCWPYCAPSCPPEASCADEAPSCGDGICAAIEDCQRCSTDCGVCPSLCGDGGCGDDESQATCPGDCLA